MLFEILKHIETNDTYYWNSVDVKFDTNNKEVNHNQYLVTLFDVGDNCFKD